MLIFKSLKNDCKIPFQNYEEAEKAAKDGEVWGIIKFGGNFTEQLISRISTSLNDGDLQNIAASQVGIHLDESSLLIINSFDTYTINILKLNFY